MEYLANTVLRYLSFLVGKVLFRFKRDRNAAVDLKEIPHLHSRLIPHVYWPR